MKLMKASQWTITGALIVFALLAALGLDRTRASAPESKAASKAEADRNSLVDQRPLLIARQLSALASTPEEQRFAQEALRLGDHEVDLAFADALRDAAQHPLKPTDQTRELAARLSKAEEQVKADQLQIAQLTKQASRADEQTKENLQQQLELTQAQTELDQDELDDAKQDFEAAGGSSQSRIQRLLDEHEAAQHDADKQHAAGSIPAADFSYLSDNLYTQFKSWRSLRKKQQQIALAQENATSTGESLRQSHNALEEKTKEQNAQKTQIKEQSAEALQAAQVQKSPSPNADTAVAVSSLKRLSEAQKSLVALDKRVQDEVELASNYGNWNQLVETHKTSAAHGMFRSALELLLVVLAVFLSSRFIDHLFGENYGNQMQRRTLRMILRFTANALGLLFIIFVIFGTPSQTPTILGLVGAGLTVALGDFVLAFFGWFLLVGRNGIRVGNWVEINGVAGEVIDIGLLRTVLLETGNWTDAGHPTGRKVTFVNSFAISGHFFNFSTAGQWLWDELQVLIPDRENPYPTIEAIQKLVVQETEANARTAEQEWQRDPAQRRVQSFSAAPGVNVRPTAEGVQLVVRYIAHAHERYELRSRLYQAVVNVLHPPAASVAAAAAGKD